MANSPPTTAGKNEGDNTPTTSTLPHSSRYPSLTSGQVSFTTAAAIRDITQVPTYVYRIQVDLKPRTAESNFVKDPWTLVARHFFASLLSFDDKAIILKKKANAPANKLSSPEELPDNPELFERDYAYDVNHRGPRLVSFKIMIATTRNFWHTFKNPTTLYKKLLANEWYVKLIRLESQGSTAEIGHLLFGHTRFLNQDDIINEIKALISPTKCDEIDIRTTKSKESYYDEDGNRQEVITKWPSIFCPIDIASKLSTLLMEKWEEMETTTNERTYNLRHMVFVPKDRDLVKFDARISNMAKQNEFLKTYREMTVLRNCTNITSNFTYSEEVVEALGSREQLGHILSLREFLGTWEDQSTGNPAIYSISRTTKNDEYALLTGTKHSKDIHMRIESLVNALRKQKAFKTLSIGGTRGAMGNKRFSDTVQRYAKRQFTTVKKYNQHPPSSKEKPEQVNEWRNPPQERKMQKQPRPSLTINHNDQRQRQQYSDVLKGTNTTINNNGSQMSISNTTGSISVGNTNGTHTIVPEHSMVALHGNEKGNKVVTKSQINSILESKEFQDTLAKIVAPQVAKQVTDLISPSVEKLSAIETQVNELHNYVNDNQNWQNQQTNRQTDLQTNMYSMSKTMNDMGSKLDKLVGLLQTTSLEEEDNPQGKRPADSLSPDHKAKMDKQQHQKAKTNHQKERTNKIPLSNEDTTPRDGATSPPATPNNFDSRPHESDEEMNSPQKRFDEVGKGQ